MFKDINTRITICTKCQEIPFIKIYVKESKAYIKTICSCGNHYYDPVTFLYLFTDRFTNNNKQAAKFKEKEILYKNNKKISIFSFSDFKFSIREVSNSGKYFDTDSFISLKLFLIVFNSSSVIKISLVYTIFFLCIKCVLLHKVQTFM